MKIAMVGAQCVGKSTLINALMNDYDFRGYQVRPEGVRFLKENYGFDIYSGNAEIQLAVLALQAKDSGEPYILLDRTVVDSLSYALYYHERKNPELSKPILDFLVHESKLIARRIDHFVFLQPSFPMEEDGTRVANYEQQADITRWMEYVIEMLEIPVGKVLYITGGSVNERVDWIKERTRIKEEIRLAPGLYTCYDF